MTRARPVPLRWAPALAAVAVVLFGAGFLVRLRCPTAGCGEWSGLLDLDAVGGLPRLFTTVLFALVAATALRTARRVPGGAARWWTAVGTLGLVLAAAKVVSVHGSLGAGVPPALQLGAGVLLAVPALAVLWLAGRQAGVAATGPVVLALAGYAAAALGLDVLTDLAALVQEPVGALPRALSTLVEELGEGLAALALLVVVRRQDPRQQ
ncbi:hypothetical protein ACI79C_05230 [Geodermatophilus sp. SYSU D00697]